MLVAPFTGAWIEIKTHGYSVLYSDVAPFTGAWIEITPDQFDYEPDGVAPFTGAWIEISIPALTICLSKSLPSRERGLKFADERLVGGAFGRSLHGSVD